MVRARLFAAPVPKADGASRRRSLPLTAGDPPEQTLTGPALPCCPGGAGRQSPHAADERIEEFRDRFSVIESPTHRRSRPTSGQPTRLSACSNPRRPLSTGLAMAIEGRIALPARIRGKIDDLDRMLERSSGTRRVLPLSRGAAPTLRRAANRRPSMHDPAPDHRQRSA